jgi:hypothetical protein
MHHHARRPIRYGNLCGSSLKSWRFWSGSNFLTEWCRWARDQRHKEGRLGRQGGGRGI